MQKALNSIAYIDNTNLYKGTQAEGFEIDYIRLRTYLQERLGVKTAYMFIGFIPKYAEMYTQFQSWGYTLVFKPTIPSKDGIKGNCDAELVLQATVDFFRAEYSRAVVVTSDGDFACVVKFLLQEKRDVLILSPRSKEKCSTLLRDIGCPITFLPEVSGRIKKQHL